MKETIKQIRELLDELESNIPDVEPSFRESFQLFELPEIVGDIVDYLQPAISSYEAAIYWYMFRHSIIATGDVFVRVSKSRLQEAIGSTFEQVSSISKNAVTKALRSLSIKGAISVAGDTNNLTGTTYRVHLPEEIQLCREAMAKAQKEQLPQVDPKRELDFYNIKENRLKVFERDKYVCHYCKKQLTRFSATLDHLHPVSHGGDNSYGNLVTACLRCNSQRGAQPLMDYLTRKQDATKI